MVARMVHEWAARDDRVVLATVKDAGHLANHDKPAAFNEVLPGFLQKHPRME